mgnify:FL=1
MTAMLLGHMHFKGHFTEIVEFDQQTGERTERQVPIVANKLAGTVTFQHEGQAFERMVFNENIPDRVVIDITKHTFLLPGEEPVLRGGLFPTVVVPVTFKAVA